MAKIIRYCKMQEQHLGENAFDVSRPNIMGNPYTHLKETKTKYTVKVATREESIERYKRYFETMIKVDDTFKNEFKRMIEACMSNDVVYLGCFCNENEECHGDYIVKRLQQECTKLLLKNLKKEN